MEKSLIEQWTKKFEETNEHQANTPPKQGLERRNWLFNRGVTTVPNFLKLIRMDDFKSQVGSLLDKLGPNDVVPLNNPLWRHIIQEEFAKLPGMRIPENPFESASEDVLFFQKGFTKEIRRVMKLALQVQ